MKQLTVLLDPVTGLFYQRIAEKVGLPIEKVISDTLFKLAAELSLEALQKGACIE